MPVRPSAPSPKPYGGALLVFILLLLTAAGSLDALRTPTPLPADAPATDFSAHRAIQHDFKIASKPHPAGSIANEKVATYIRDTLRSYGVKADIVSSYMAKGHRAGRHDMVLARIPGTANTKAFALMAHYDSVPYGPGAADDCSGVVSMIEVARALKAGPPLKNDIIFVFTDGEEGAKLGSTAFAAHPWFKDVGVMANLEARGTTGNSIMFDTSDQNGWLIDHWIRAVRYPCATSLSYAVYKRLPFSTDFDVLRPRGMKGFDSAFLGNFAWYHTANDTPQHLDLGTLQQHGENALDLARYFGNIPLDGPLTAPNEMYFNTLGYHMAHYPLSWDAPLAVAATVLVFITLVVGRARRHLSIPGVLAGVVVWAVIAAISAAVSLLLLAVIWGPSSAVSLYTKDFTRIPNLYPLYHNTLYSVVFATTSLAFAALIYGPLCRWIRAQSLTVGAFVWWTAGTILLARYLPGGSYLLMWPLTFAALGMLLCVTMSEPGPITPAWVLVLTAFVAPAIILFIPAYHVFASTIMIMAAPGLALFMALLMGLLIPQLDLLARVNGWLLPTLAFSAVVIMTGYGLVNSSFTPLRPKLDSLSYGIDYDTHRAYWLSPDPSPDEWTSQFFRLGAPRDQYSEFAWSRGDTVMKAFAPIARQFPGPQITVEQDRTSGGVRDLTIHIASPAKAAQLILRMMSDTKVLDASVFGKPLAAGNKHWRLDFDLFPRKGADVTLTVPAGKPVRLNACELFYGLPNLPEYHPRPKYIVCTPNTVNHHGHQLESNRIFVSRTVTLPEKRKRRT